MLPGGIGPTFLRGLANAVPDLLSEVLLPGRVLDAEVVSVFGDRAILSFARQMRVEVQLQTQLREGQRVQVQVQPREQGTPQGEARPSIVLKVVDTGGAGERMMVVGQATVTPEAVQGQVTQAPQGQTQAPLAQTPGQAQSQAALPTAPQAAAPGPQQPGAPQLQWLPIPLPQGGQAWAQIHVQEDPARRARTKAPAPVHQVRIWWETPGLGPVQVNLDAHDTNLTALFTIAEAETRDQVEAGLTFLQRQLNEIGFTETKLGARQTLPGEVVGPARPGEPGRLNRLL